MDTNIILVILTDTQPLYTYTLLHLVVCKMMGNY